MPRQLSDAVELLRFEAELEELCMSAFRSWAPEVEAAVLPELEGIVASLVAAGSDLPPMPEGVGDVGPAWKRLLLSKIMPGVEKLVLRRLASRMEKSGAAEAAKIARADLPADPLLTTIYGGRKSRDARTVYQLPSQRQWQADYLADVENRMSDTPDTVFRAITAEVAAGTSKGESIPKLRDRVHTLLRGNNLAMWRGRATTIARTEAVGAFNGATLRAAIAQQVLLGVELEKAWVATIDGRTRKTHFAADGQRRPLDGKFKVGRANLDRPGDPRGPAEEVVNCRCTIIEVEPGDALPGETDRQTERGPGDATVRNRSGSRQDEIDRRAADGVIRARDDDGGDGIVAAATGGEPMEREWTGVLAPLGKPTGDGRMFDENMAVSFRDFPLPLMWQQQTSDFPHSQAYTVGSIREATVEGGVIKASGILFATPEADEAEAQLKEGVTRPSVDLCDDTWELRDGDGNLIDPEAMWDMTEEELADVVMCFTAATVMGATLVAKPAFAEAKIEVGGEVDEDEDEDAPEEETDDADKPEETEDTDAEPEETDDEDKTKAAVGSSTVAAPSVTEAEQALLAAAPLRPQFDAGLFSDPGLTEPTRLQYDPKTGRVWGHVATWGVCHLGVRDKCIMAPTSAQQYAQFHTHEVDTADGPLAVGVLSYGSGHANPRAGLSVALEHYDNAATAWAFVRAGEDATGVWVSGVVSPFADPEEVSMALTAPLSGDWRRVGGSLELCAALSVNTPGFHPGGAHDEQGRPLSLVAAGVVPVEKREASAAFRSMVAAAVREELGRQQRHAALTASAGARGLLPTPVPSDDDRARRARALALKMGRR